MDLYQYLQEQYKCSKCNNRSAMFKEVSFSKVSEKILGGQDKYLLVSCTLCGFTEMYNLKVLVKCQEKNPLKASVLEAPPSQ